MIQTSKRPIHHTNEWSYTIHAIRLLFGIIKLLLSEGLTRCPQTSLLTKSLQLNLRIGPAHMTRSFTMRGSSGIHEIVYINKTKEFFIR